MKALWSTWINWCKCSVRISVRKPKPMQSQQPIIVSTISPGELEVKTSKLPEARENAGVQVANGFSFESDWSRKW